MNTSKYLTLQKKLKEIPQKDYSTKSRVHPLNSFSNASETQCLIKREDELGFGISGSKFRKYRTLIPYILNNELEEAVIVGGAFSNHVLSLTQLLIENGIKPTLFLKGPEPLKKIGNFLFLKLLVPDSSIHWIAKNDWPEINSLISSYIRTRKEVITIPEGATLFPSFLGALSLPLDIVRNEHEIGFPFNHVFLDAGTGYSAAALLLGFAFLEVKSTCHLLLLADKEEVFSHQLQDLHAEFENWLGEPCPFPTQFQCYRSSLAPSFGSTNKLLFDFLIDFSRNEGVFLDPIYSAKLFYHAKQLLDTEKQINGKVLVVHSGGALTLAGFQEQLEKSINKI